VTLVTNKRSVMTLFTNKISHYSHRVRLVLAEKGVTVDFVEVDPNDRPEELMELNPYGMVPTLVDRDLVLYEANIIVEYLEERFPHPPLMPVYPVARARSRLMLSRIDRDWFSLVDKINKSQGADQARKDLYDSLLSVAPVFADSPFFLSEEFTLVDCSLATLLWRLPSLGIDLPETGKPIMKYAKRLFARPTFQASLSDAEKEMRQ
jgi:RNA polymerase-associated protein